MSTLSQRLFDAAAKAEAQEALDEGDPGRGDRSLLCVAQFRRLAVNHRIMAILSDDLHEVPPQITAPAPIISGMDIHARSPALGMM